VKPGKRHRQRASSVAFYHAATPRRLIVYAAASRQLPITHHSSYPTMPAAQPRHHTAPCTRRHRLFPACPCASDLWPDRNLAHVSVCFCCTVSAWLRCVCMPRSLVRSHAASVMAGQSNASRLEHYKLCLVHRAPYTAPIRAWPPCGSPLTLTGWQGGGRGTQVYRSTAHATSRVLIQEPVCCPRTMLHSHPTP
jgi:hypothetical protein